MKKKYIKIIALLFTIITLNKVFAEDTFKVLPFTDNGITYFSLGGMQTKYYNKDDNSDIMGNYLAGYYYNKLYGYFKLDWSSDINNNVKIVGSTSKCTTGYGYKLGGLAQSGTGELVSTAGYIDFDYDNNNFVYYCIDDGKLHGKAFSKIMGFQDFEGLILDALPSNNNLIPTFTQDKFFVNNTTNIYFIKQDIESLKYGAESVFYIWKPKNNFIY